MAALARGWLTGAPVVGDDRVLSDAGRRLEADDV